MAGIVQRIADGLANVMSGAGTSVDRRMHQHWQRRAMDQLQVETAFRSSWLMRKIVTLPPHDMTRKWRNWQAESDQIELLEAEEKRLHVAERIKAGLTLGRLGGGILIMGVQQGDPINPLNTATIGKQGLRYLHPLSRHQVTLGPLVTDPNADDFGEPEWFELRGKNGNARIHRSRCLVFKGAFGGGLSGVTSTTTTEDAYWGDSIVESVNDAVMNATTAQDEIAGLIAEAKIDVFGIPDLLAMMGDPVREKQIMRRLELAQQGKSVHRAMIKDANETFEQRQISWGGMPEVIRVYLSIVAGASDIPATRLLGKSPDGMNSTGDSDERNYHEMIESAQTAELRPALEVLDEVLIPSALGTRPPELHFTFAPLRVLNEQEEAEIEEREANTMTAVVNTGLIPEEALAQAFANRLIESGRWPGLEGALEDLGERWWEVAADDDPEGPVQPVPAPGAPLPPNPKPTPANAPPASE